jgi:hypothetical protein
MNANTTLFLLLLLALLGGAAWYQTESEKTATTEQRRLFEGLENSRVFAVRVDNLERAQQLRFEADAAGRWHMTDPILYPANRATLESLLEDVNGATGIAVPENERGEKALGFDTPRIVLEVDERAEDGTVNTYTLEVGAEDLDRNLMNVRVDGVYLRCLSRLYTTLNQNLDEFRSKFPLMIDPRSVVEVHRRGKIQYSVRDEAVDTEFSAIMDGNQWFGITPIKALLDAFPINLLIHGATSMEIATFVDDQCTDWTPYGLDKPLCRIEYKSGQGSTEVLLLSRLGNSSPWFLTREGTPYVWSILEESALRLLLPAEGMVDLRYMRALRADVAGVEFSYGEQQLLLERESRGWTVAARLGESESSVPLLADERKIEDLFTRLEELEFYVSPELDVYGHGGVAPAFDLRGSVRVTVGRDTQGGDFGFVEGMPDLMFRRFGDDLPLVAPAWFPELAKASIADYRSLQLTRLTEVNVASMRLKRGEDLLVYNRDNHGIWHAQGEEAEATEILPLLDSMIYLKASQFPSSKVTSVDEIAVEFLGHTGESTAFLVLLDSQGHCFAQIGEIQALLKRGDLFEGLASLWVN